MMERLSEDEIEATAASDDVEMEREGQRTKKGRWMVQLSIELIKKWPCIQPCRSSNYKFTCTICQCAVSCEHQGEKDVRRHIDGKKHCSNVQGLENQKQIHSFFPSENDPLQEKVTRAEVKVATVLAHHDIPIAVTDHLSPLFKDIFPDSSIAKLYSCARTKTTCILNGCRPSEVFG